MHTTPLRVRRLHTKAMRLMLVSRSSRLKPSPLLKCVRTISPSSTSTLCPRSFRHCLMISARVLLPEPESPVNQSVKPVCAIACFLLSGIQNVFGPPLHRATTRVAPTMDGLHKSPHSHHCRADCGRPAAGASI